ncbi:MAG: HIT family protein [Firmicutes bacterium]|jgi:diadenosine tetraphosphate (Ap4A) HIT family hydrolase|nr:HIT family protein [Bacillota bacterium]
MDDTCIFCSIDRETLAENELAFAILDRFPAATGHSLVIPRRHVLTMDELTGEEALALFALIRQVKTLLRERFGPDGFNIGINEGEAAGQTVMHLHIHIIPRTRGDVENPRGGIRKVLPCRRRYRHGEGPA